MPCLGAAWPHEAHCSRLALFRRAPHGTQTPEGLGGREALSGRRWPAANVANGAEKSGIEKAQCQGQGISQRGDSALDKIRAGSPGAYPSTGPCVAAQLDHRPHSSPSSINLCKYCPKPLTWHST